MFQWIERGHRVRVTILGSGYVGLVTGACLAEMGNQVICVDTNQEKIAALNDGHVPIYEPGLEELISKNLSLGNIAFQNQFEQAIQSADCIFICVGTPAGADGAAELRFIHRAAQTIGQYLDRYKVIVDKSTVPVGTVDVVAEEIEQVLRQRQVDIEFDVASNPEFLKEGTAVADFMKPDRIIIGSDKPKAIDLLIELYTPFNRNHDRVLVMDPRSAELTKYAANAMLATKISFMNEMANIAEIVGADVEKVRLGIGSDPRIGFQFIYPGVGYGGSCLPKDVKAIQNTAYLHGHYSELLSAVDKINERQKLKIYDKICRYFNNQLEGKTIALWGLAFKPNTDDIREAPSVALIQRLLQRDVKIQAYDPVAMEEVASEFPEQPLLTLSANAYDALEGADALVLLTEWHEFRSPNFAVIKEKLGHPVIFDGRNIYRPETLANYGISYYGIGRSQN